MYEDVLLPVDRAPRATELTAEKAFELAGAFDATVHAVHVQTDADAGSTQYDREEQRVKPFTYVEGVVADWNYTPNIEYELLTGGAKARICEYADDVGADVIVMATHARSGVERLALGSVTEAVVREASCPVLAMNRDE
jgi:nucleotide-binding universal stress UspA family protein